MRLPRHIGIIPDGNRRWASSNGIPNIKGWERGIDPGYLLFRLLQKTGIEEVTFYGYTVENARRPIVQRNAIIDACIEGVKILSREDAELLVVGNSDSKMFPKQLLPYSSKRVTFGKGGIKVNFLVNYGWEWDLSNLRTARSRAKGIISQLKSCEISKIDLIIRWGGWSRLSGFLPVQSAYADIFIVNDLWPDFKPLHFTTALDWYAQQDITLGG